MYNLISEFLIKNYYFYINIILLITATLFFINGKRIFNLFTGVSKKNWVMIFLIIFTGFIIRMWFIPHVHHVYFDEFDHINIAQNMLYNSLFSITYQGEPEICKRYIMPFWPPGYHAMLSLILKVFGDSELVAYNFSVVIGSLSILIVFLIVFMLFNNQKIALYCAFLFSLIPVHLKYSGATELGVTSLFFILTTLLICLYYLRIQNIRSLLLLVFTTAFTIYIRTENIFLLFFIPLFMVLNEHSKDFNKKKISQHFIIFFTSLFFILALDVLHLYLGLFVSPPPGWGQGLFMRMTNLKNNLTGNLGFWFSRYHPVTITLISIFGFYRLTKRHKKIALFFLLWYLIFLLFYSQYHIGNFTFCSDGDRYALNLYISLIVFAGFGLFELVSFFRAKGFILTILLICMIVNVFFSLRFGLNRTFSRDVYSEYQFILSSKDLIRDNLYVISASPSAIISTIHKKSIMPDILIELEDMPEEVVLFKDFWWYQEETNFCSVEKELKTIYEFETLSQTKIAHNKPISFIKLNRKKGM